MKWRNHLNPGIGDQPNPIWKKISSLESTIPVLGKQRQRDLLKFKTSMGCLCSSKSATGHKKKKHGLSSLQSSYNEGLYWSSRICFQVIISDPPYLKFSLKRARSTSISKYLFTLYFVPIFCTLGSIVFGSADSTQCLTHPRPSALPLSSMPSPRNFTVWFTTIYTSIYTLFWPPHRHQAHRTHTHTK